MLGAGDVKLFLICSLVLTFKQFIYFLLCSTGFALLVGLAGLFRDKDVIERAQYFCSYVIAVARSKEWGIYRENGKATKRGIHMAGPILLGYLVCLMLSF